MGKIAFLFPGQGAQYPGMGRELMEISPAAAKIFRLADDQRPGTSEQCFHGTEESLRETKITQPCMFTVETAGAAALTEAGIIPDMVAGFSLGEWSAVSYTGLIDWSTSFSLVTRRGELMQAAAEATPAAMVAVVRLDNETVERVCGQFTGAYPVNYNCPGQVTVALLKERMTEFSGAVKAAGGRALPLKVGGGFHSPFMAETAEEFGCLLEEIQFHEPKLPLYSNLTGRPYGGDVRQLLSRQICSSVRWEETIRHMISAGVDTFIEVGPGSVLGGLVGKIHDSVRVFGVSDKESLEKTVKEVKSC